jgi:hypothetical protein
MIESVRIKVVNGSAVVAGENGVEQYVTTGDWIYVPVPEGYRLIPKPVLLDKGIPEQRS